MKITYCTAYLFNDKKQKGVPDKILKIEYNNEVIWIIPDGQFGVTHVSDDEIKKLYSKII